MRTLTEIAADAYGVPMRLRHVLAVFGVAAITVPLAGCISITIPGPVATGVPSVGESPRATTDSSAGPGSTASTASPPSPASPTSTDSPVDAETRDCSDGGSHTVSGAVQTFRVIGTCTELVVSGSRLTVDASAAMIGTLRVSGDGIRADIAGADEVVVQGDDGTVKSAASIGRLEISGDRTVTEAASGIPAVVVRGDDNVVRSGGRVGSAVVEGSGNTIR
ncbi:hypothetical protein [Microbacterium enclense]|uniref:hypothetical protein n=1 Tax=Microbacterium enclense TaxID=993073 RepID=UPI003434765F